MGDRRRRAERSREHRSRADQRPRLREPAGQRRVGPEPRGHRPDRHPERRFGHGALRKERLERRYRRDDQTRQAGPSRGHLLVFGHFHPAAPLYGPFGRCDELAGAHLVFARADEQPAGLSQHHVVARLRGFLPRLHERQHRLQRIRTSGELLRDAQHRLVRPDHAERLVAPPHAEPFGRNLQCPLPRFAGYEQPAGFDPGREEQDLHGDVQSDGQLQAFQGDFRHERLGDGHRRRAFRP